jgi:hypothetical protein
VGVNTDEERVLGSFLGFLDTTHTEGVSAPKMAGLGGIKIHAVSPY